VGWGKWRAGAQKQQYLRNAWRQMKSYYGGPIGTRQRSFEQYHPDPVWPPLPKIGGSQPQPQTAMSTPYYLGNG